MTEFEKHRKKFKYNKESVSSKRSTNNPILRIHRKQSTREESLMTNETRDLINRFGK